MTNSIISFLDKASTAYYTGFPIIADSVFDALAARYKYNKVGYSTNKGVKHLYRMYSLKKYYDTKDIPDLFIQNKTVCTPKLDGAAISILYIEGNLSLVLSRGDGIEGIDITDKFLKSHIIPHNIPQTDIIQINGEIVAPKHIENSRNYAAGSLNLKDSEEFSTRALSFFAYKCNIFYEKSYEKTLKLLSKYGFRTVLEPNLQDVYPTDGLVVHLDDEDLIKSVGYTFHHPKFAYALKVREKEHETYILDVVWQTGKSRRITPVAILEPIEIEGKVVSRATLNNVGFIKALDLQIGDKVAIRLAGKIIPEIVARAD